MFAIILRLIGLGVVVSGIVMVLRNRQSSRLQGDSVPLTPQRLRMLLDAERRQAHDEHLVDGVDL